MTRGKTVLAVILVASLGAATVTVDVRATPSVRSEAAVSSSPCAARLALQNGSFEQPTVNQFAEFDESKVPGWHTTASDHKIEIWHSGYLGVPAADGQQFAELNANEPSELYQDVPTTPGQTVFYRVFHRGRNGVDTMAIQIGAPGQAPNFARLVSTGERWERVTGTYLVPAGQTMTRFGFKAISSIGGLTMGNFLDGIAFGQGLCRLTVAKTLIPASDRGRFDLLVDGSVAAAGVGNGGGSGLIDMPLSYVTVSERAAGSTDLSHYASAIRCVDSVSREVVAQVPGTALIVRYDRPRRISCRFVNVLAPAVVLQKAVAPDTDPGRFDLLVGGEIVARTAANGTVSTPTGVAAGPVTVAEVGAPGTRLSDYQTAIQCRSRAGLGPVIASAIGPRATVNVSGKELVLCTPLNVRKGVDPAPTPPAPAPPPTPPAPPSTPPAPPVPPDTDALDLVTHVAPVDRLIPAGSIARFRVRVTNRGPLNATNVRIAAIPRRSGTPRSLVFVSSDAGGPCVVVRRGGVCMLPRLGAGTSTTLEFDVATTSDRRQQLGVRAIAVAHEPELTPSNNAADAAVRTFLPPSPIVTG